MLLPRCTLLYLHYGKDYTGLTASFSLFSGILQTGVNGQWEKTARRKNYAKAGVWKATVTRRSTTEGQPALKALMKHANGSKMSG